MSDTSRNIIGALATILALLAYAPYFRDILRKKTKPHAISWLIWTIVGGVAFFGQQSDSAGPGSWVIGTVAVICFAIFLLSIFRGENEIRKFDWTCLACSLCAVPLWIVTDSPLLSVLLVTTIDATGFLPTFRKTWKKPYEETLTTYSINTAHSLLSIAALDHVSVITVIYPLMLAVMNFAVSAMIIARRSKMPTTT